MVSGLMDSFATAISMALQYGVPLEVLVNKFSHARFEPSGFTNNPQIPIAKSIVDYIFRWLASKFLPKEDQKRLGILDRGTEEKERPALPSEEEPSTGESQEMENQEEQALPYKNIKVAFQVQEDSPPCPECGAIMVRNGSCYKCLECGATSGCS